MSVQIVILELALSMEAAPEYQHNSQYVARLIITCRSCLPVKSRRVVIQYTVHSIAVETVKRNL